MPVDLQTGLSGKAIHTHYVDFAPGNLGGVTLYVPETKRMIIRRTFKVTGPVDQEVSNLTYEALEFKIDETTPVKKDDDMPELRDDCDSDDEENKDTIHDGFSYEFGRDHGIEHDPIESPIAVNIPIVPKLIPKKQFVVERIVNHKGFYKQPATMKLFVKRLG